MVSTALSLPAGRGRQSGDGCGSGRTGLPAGSTGPGQVGAGLPTGRAGRGPDVSRESRAGVEAGAVVVDGEAGSSKIGL